MHRPDSSPIGQLLRDWRMRRRRSQLDLALDAGVSTRHLSCVETGRARPSRELLLKLFAELELPLREQNRLLLAAGLAPQYPERPLHSEGFSAARAAIERLLEVHEPNPALAVDPHWNVLLANRPAQALLALVSPSLLKPPVNLLRLTLHPQGLAAHLENLAEWRPLLLDRLRRQAAQSGDPVLADLYAELRALPTPLAPPVETASGPLPELTLPMRLRTPTGVIALIGTVTVFGTPQDLTLSEVAIEALYPVDPESAARLAALVAG